MNLRDFNANTLEDKIIEACQKIESATSLSDWAQVYLNYLLGLLHFKQQKQLLDEQNKFNEKIVKYNQELVKTNKKLVRATWTLAIATIILAIATVVFAFIK